MQIVIVVLFTCKNEEDPIKNEGARVVTTLFIDFSDAQGQLTPKSVMESCLNSGQELEWSQGFTHYNPMGAICCHGNQSSDPIWPKT